jgi:hypothetical protein
MERELTMANERFEFPFPDFSRSFRLLDSFYSVRDRSTPDLRAAVERMTRMPDLSAAIERAGKMSELHAAIERAGKMPELHAAIERAGKMPELHAAI